MKTFFVLLLIALLLVSCKDKVPTFQINGKTVGVHNGKRIYIKQLDSLGKFVVIDTAIVKENRFSFEGITKEPTYSFIIIDGSIGFLPFVLENTAINIEVYKDSLKSSKIIGSPLTEKFNNLQEKALVVNKELSQLYKKLRTAQNEKDEEKIKAINADAKNLQEKQKNVFINYVEEHPNSYVSLIILKSFATNSQNNIEVIQKLYNGLSENIKKSDQASFIKNKIALIHKSLNKAKTTAIGKVAPNFSAPNPNGKILALNDIKGKVTLIDFWASWCGPCRRENPNVVKIYNEFHEKGLEIISVSLDKSNQKQKWIDAIEKDGMIWHHISNLEYFKEPIAKLYSIKSIPSTLLLNEKGEIVYKNLRGNALRDAVAKMLN